MKIVELQRAERLSALSAIVIDAQKALRDICDLDEADCAKYVAKADDLALSALVRMNLALDDIYGTERGL